MTGRFCFYITAKAAGIFQGCTVGDRTSQHNHSMHHGLRQIQRKDKLRIAQNPPAFTLRAMFAICISYLESISDDKQQGPPDSRLFGG